MTMEWGIGVTRPTIYRHLSKVPSQPQAPA
jgi:hypothetical protein